MFRPCARGCNISLYKGTVAQGIIQVSICEMSQDGEQEYHTDSDDFDLQANTPLDNTAEQAASVPLVTDTVAVDEEVRPRPQASTNRKRLRESDGADVSLKIKQKLSTRRPHSVASDASRSAAKRPIPVSTKPKFDADRCRLVEYGSHLERHLEQLAEYVIKCKWHPGDRGSQTRIEGKFWGTQMSGANICKTLAALLGPNDEPGKNVPYNGDVYRSLIIGAAVDPTCSDVYKEAVNVIGDMSIRNMIVGAYINGDNDIVAKVAAAHKTDVDMATRDPKRLIQCLNAGVSTLITQQWGKATASWLD